MYMYTDYVGSIEDMRNFQVQFVNKIYNPEFIADDDGTAERSDMNNDDMALMNNANGSDLENNTVVMKTATRTCIAVKRKSIEAKLMSCS